MIKIRKAVIPAAGLGMRMQSLSQSIPKEMLLVADQPMIQWSVEELLASGIEQIFIVISPQKESIKDYFLKTGIKGLNFVYQEKPLGVVQALLKTEKYLEHEPFILLFPDQLLIAQKPATQQLIRHYFKKEPAIWTSLVKIPQKEIIFVLHRLLKPNWLMLSK